jgi:alanine-synthesizing transaminase
MGADRTHFRVTLLPEAPVLREVFARIERVLDRRADRVAASRTLAACA